MMRTHRFIKYAFLFPCESHLFRGHVSFAIVFCTLCCVMSCFSICNYGIPQPHSAPTRHLVLGVERARASAFNMQPKTPGCRPPVHLVKENFDAREAHVKLAVRYAEVFAWDLETAHEELDEAKTQVAAFDKDLDRQLKAETSAEAAEAAHSRG